MNTRIKGNAAKLWTDFGWIRASVITTLDPCDPRADADAAELIEEFERRQLNVLTQLARKRLGAYGRICGHAGYMDTIKDRITVERRSSLWGLCEAHYLDGSLLVEFDVPEASRVIMSSASFHRYAMLYIECRYACG